MLLLVGLFDQHRVKPGSMRFADMAFFCPQKEIQLTEWIIVSWNLLSVALLVGSKASVIQYAPPPSHSLFGHAVFWWEVRVKSSESTVSILALPFSATPALLASASRADIPVLSTEVLWAASQSCPLPAGETAGNFFLHFFQVCNSEASLQHQKCLLLLFIFLHCLLPSKLLDIVPES